ncbi:Putative stage V sporulation protein B, partial [Candidatus Arthromitus sp. SFB-2]
SEFNIYGAVLATIFSYILTSYLNFSAIKKKLNINLNILDIIITPLFSSLLMIIIALLSFDYFYKMSGSTVLSIFICGIIGGIIYILSLVLFKMRELSSIFTSIK